MGTRLSFNRGGKMRMERAASARRREETHQRGEELRGVGVKKKRGEEGIKSVEEKKEEKKGRNERSCDEGKEEEEEAEEEEGKEVEGGEEKNGGEESRGGRRRGEDTPEVVNQHHCQEFGRSAATMHLC